MKNTLQDILLSDLINLALDDLEECEKDPNYHINMLLWHCPDERAGYCEVCLAGAVMAKTLDASPACAVNPCNFPYHVMNCLKALESVREGWITEALITLEQAHDEKSVEVFVPPYRPNPIGFKDTLRDLALTLREKGL